MAPSTLRLGQTLEEPGPRITTAAGGRGGRRICLYFYLRAFRSATRWRGSLGNRLDRRPCKSSACWQPLFDNCQGSA